MKTWKVRFPARLALTASLVWGCGGAALAQDKVIWVRDPVQDEPVRAGLRIPCGSYGVFHFNQDGGVDSVPAPPPAPIPPPILHAADLCKDRGPDCDSGEETPPFYPQTVIRNYQSAQLTPAQPTFPIGVNGFKRRSRVAAKSNWSPCLDGSCFDANKASGPVPTAPWVAVVDWNDPHGWSVGWTIRELLGDGFDLVLLPFLTSDLATFSGKGATDVHTLAKLCEISDAVDLHSAPPPAAINLSFGRYFRPGIDSDRGTLCQSDKLSCQIVRVLEHLYRKPTGPGTGTVIVAAAGNYRSLQFPAAAQVTIPAGALDLNAFAAAQPQISATWETAPELSSASRARALFPASAICLEASLGQTGSPSWVAPPGTSYSSAALAAWLALELRSQSAPAFDPLLPALWSLRRVCGSPPATCTYSLAQGSQRIFGPHPNTDLFFNRLFLAAKRRCGPPPATGLPTVDAIVLGAATEDPTVSSKSFLQVAGGWELPSPDSDPCIPCQGSRQPPPKSASFDPSVTAPPTPGPSLPTPLPTDGDVLTANSDWTVDFSAGGSFIEGVVVDSIHLRSGAQFRRLSVTADGLRLLQAGGLNGVYLRGGGSLVSGAVQASLIFVLRKAGDQDRYWTSLPVYFP